MNVHLADLPADVLLVVVSFLPLPDVFSLTEVSQTFHHLSADRGFWLAPLQNTPHLRCVQTTCTWAIRDLDTAGLKALARRAVKLDANWSLPRPRIVGPVRKWQIGDRSVLESNCLFQFPTTTGLFVFHSSRLLKSFNAATNEYATILDLDAYVRSASYAILPDGSVNIGLALRGGPRFNTSILVFAKLKLSPRKSAVAGTLLLRQTLTAESDCEKPFVSAKVVGAVRSRDKTTEVLAYNLSTGRSTIVETDIPINYTVGRYLQFSFREDNLYMLADDGNKALIYCCPRDMLPYDQYADTGYSLRFGHPRPIQFETAIWKRRVIVASQMLPDANFVKVHDVLGPPGSTFATNFRFWGRADRFPATRALSKEAIVPGVCPGEFTMQTSLSGQHVVAALLGPGQSGCSLILVSQYGDGECASHELELPADRVDAPPPNVLSVDDFHGVVWLAAQGELLAIPYA
ncbi:F-box domain-containing protein [Mycena kentingensis (nom. inval.)]|nr:F-box domain-containing protein [Mycena kentingensis (nom. inval.)]